ncbi:MAG: LysE family translocator [Actinomycetota bacterium]|nr:LysE family translocator [Actinomycetota bacterium]
MPTTATLVVFAGTSLALLLVPGPAVLYIVTRSAAQGPAAGVASVLGIHAGTLVHIAAATAGLSALIVASASAFTAVKLAGAAYLVYLGLTTLWRGVRNGGGDVVGPAPHRLGRVFTDGFVVNVLNPKTAVFFLAFVPQFVDPAVGGARTQIVVLGAVFVVLGLVSDGIYALAASRIGRLVRSAGANRRRDVAVGCTYLGLGVVAALTGRPASD